MMARSTWKSPRPGPGNTALARRPAAPIILASIAGVADCAPIFGYIFASSPASFAAGGIVAKLIILFFLPFRRQALTGASFVLVFAFLSALSLFASPYQNTEAPLQLAALSASLLLSVLIVADGDRLNAYGKAFVNTVCATSVLYLALVIVGDIPIYKRASYFSESHPNLGSEINAVAAVAACIFFRPRNFLPRVAILAAPVLFMQGRSALLTMILALAISFLHDGMALVRRYPAAIFAAFFITVGAVTMTAMGFTEQLVQTVFMTDDPYRGQGTGLVGRTDRWERGYDLFMQSPIIGNGAAIYDVRNIDSPHNFFLYGFANLGLMFLIILGLMVYHGARMWQRDRRAASILAASVAMLILNDRFFNLNPYPFVFFVLLLGFSMLPLPQASAKGSRGLRSNVPKSALRAQLAAQSNRPDAHRVEQHLRREI